MDSGMTDDRGGQAEQEGRAGPLDVEAGGRG